MPKITRKQVIDAILEANSVGGVEKARELRNQWLFDNPNDFGVWDGSRGLEKVASILGMPFVPMPNPKDEP